MMGLLHIQSGSFGRKMGYFHHISHKNRLHKLDKLTPHTLDRIRTTFHHITKSTCRIPFYASSKIHYTYYGKTGSLPPTSVENGSLSIAYIIQSAVLLLHSQFYSELLQLIPK